MKKSSLFSRLVIAASPVLLMTAVAIAQTQTTLTRAPQAEVTTLTAPGYFRSHPSQ